MKQRIGNIGFLNLMNATEESIKGIESIDNVGKVVFKQSNAYLLQRLNIGNIGSSIEVPDGYHYYQGTLNLDSAYLDSISEPVKLVVGGLVVVDKEVKIEDIEKCSLRLIVNGTVYSPHHLAGSIYSSILEEAKKVVVYDKAMPRFESGTLIITNQLLHSFDESQWLDIQGELILSKDLNMDEFNRKIEKIDAKGSVTLYQNQEPYVLRKMDSVSSVEFDVIPDGYDAVEKALILNSRSIRRFSHKKLWLNDPLLLEADVSREGLMEAIEGILTSSFIACPETLEDLIYERSNLEADVLPYKHQIVMIEGEEKWSQEQFKAYDHPVNLIVTGRLTLDDDVTEEILSNQVLSVDLYGDIFVSNAKLKGKVRSLLRVNEGRLEVPNVNGTEFGNIGSLSL